MVYIKRKSFSCSEQRPSVKVDAAFWNYNQFTASKWAKVIILNGKKAEFELDGFAVSTTGKIFPQRGNIFHCDSGGGTMVILIVLCSC